VEKYRFVTDQLGSVRLLVKLSNGAIAQKWDYDAWGVATFDDPASSEAIDFQPFGYAGGLYDPATGLVRFGARDYDPSIGRWTSKDPIGFGGGQANLYAYVGGDPINWIDPEGELPIAPIVWGFVVGAGTDLALQLLRNGGSFSCVDWGDVAISGALGALAGGFFGKARQATGPLKQWVRIGPSYSKAAGEKVAMSVRWGASPAGKGKYIKQIGSPTLQKFNQWLRAQKLPGNWWRVKDPGHLHLWK
jgi:RHS repeat-associated protein